MVCYSNDLNELNTNNIGSFLGSNRSLSYEGVNIALMIRGGVSNYRKLELFLEPPIEKVL